MLHEVGDLCEQQAGADDERNHPGRQQEPHRDENGLRRNCEHTPELELDARRERVADEAHEERGDRECALLLQREHRAGGRDEEERDQPESVAALRALRTLCAAELDEGVLVDRA